MKLGTCLPSDPSVQINGQVSLEKAAEALAAAGIRGCLTNFPGDESQWAPHARDLKKALAHAGVELLEYNPPFFLSCATAVHRQLEAERIVRLFELAQEAGCLNVGTCLANRNSIYPDFLSRSQEYYDNARAACELIGRLAEKRGLRARLLLELVYTTVTWSPAQMLRLLADVDSPNVEAHIDIANCLTFDTLYAQREFMEDAFRQFRGKPFRSAHLKDILPLESYFPGLHEVLVGDGIMDIPTYLRLLETMGPGFPVVIEHMHDMKDIARSYERTCAMAKNLGIEVWS